MGSVQEYGIKCPVCGHPALMRDFYYKTGEESCFCRCCGYSKNLSWKKSDDGKPVLEVIDTLDLSKDRVVFGVPSAIGEDGLFTRIDKAEAVEPGMDQDALTGMLRSSLSAWLFRQLPGGYEQVSFTRYGAARIDGTKLEILEPALEEHEHGGYGIIRMGDAQEGIVALYSLDEGATLESAIEAIPEKDKKSILSIAVFSPRGKDPVFYEDTAEDWFARSDEDGE